MQFSMVGTRNSLHSIDMVYSMLITGTNNNKGEVAVWFEDLIVEIRRKISGSRKGKKSWIPVDFMLARRALTYLFQFVQSVATFLFSLFSPCESSLFNAPLLSILLFYRRFLHHCTV